ncbi:MAG: S8 family serine peptidase [Planctomycetota bacterium]|nr:S8 family serine peptidase [Planctomycetota bacterium]
MSKNRFDGFDSSLQKNKKNHRKTKRVHQRKRQLNLEKLEDRSMLSAIGLNTSGPGEPGFDDLVVNVEDYHQSRIIVQFEETAMPSSTVEVGQRKLEIGERIGREDSLRRVHVPVGLTVETALTQLRKRPDVKFAELDYRVDVTGAPNDPSFGQLWGLHNTGQSGGTADADIDALEAWEITTGSSSTIVAVIDTGVDYTHQDLAGNMWVNTGEIAGNGVDDDGNGYIDDIHGYDFYDSDGDPMDTGGHGTHVAGTIGAVGDNGSGVVGVNWDVQIMALRFLGPDGGYISDAVLALNYAVDNGAQISNNSWGGGGFSNSMYTAISNARSNGHLFVAAAGNDYGNDNDSNPHYPSNYDLDNVVSVASTTRNDQLSSFSNIGSTTVDLAAPGSSIYSTLPGDSYGTLSGTSMATPHVSGAIALVKSHDPSLSYQEILDRIYGSVDPLPALDGQMVTGGRLNVATALAGESAAIFVTPVSGLQTSESGATASFTVMLATQPTANVTLSLLSSDPSEGTTSTSELTFTPANWGQAQTVVVSGVDDPDLDGDILYDVILEAASSSDSNYDGLNPADVSVTNLDNEVAEVDFYFSVGNNNVSVGNVLLNNEDIVARTTNGDYRVIFDGSDLGLLGLTIDAFSVVDDQTILMSFTAPGSIDGLGTVDDSDIVQFTGQFGPSTFGNLALFFDGSDVGLTSSGEDIDAIKLLGDSTLLVSTVGNYSVNGASGSDEDLIQFEATGFGNTTSGSWSIYFDGSDVGLSNSSGEDVDAVAVDGDGNILLSTRGNFSVSGVSGADEDVFVFSPTRLGSSTSGSFDSQLFFDGSTVGLGSTDLFAIDIPFKGSSNEKPVALDDEYLLDEDTVLDIGGPGVLANDYDPEGQPLTASLVSGPTSGTINFNTDGSFTYVPDENYYGTDVFQYRASDGLKDSDVATVTLTVESVNDAPVGTDDTYSTDRNQRLTVSAAEGVLVNDEDVDNDALVATLISGPSHGTLDLGADGSFDYQPDADFVGSDSFVYQADDGLLNSDPVLVTLTVNETSTGTKFFVVDTRADDTFEYDANGELVENYALAGSVPRGITTTSDGSTAWVIDNNDFVYVYDDSGSLLGSWYASGLRRPEGIALDGDDLLIVDRGLDAVLRFTGAALRRGGSQAFDSGFYLWSGNGSARGITTDGYYIWVVNDARNFDRVYKYSADAMYYGYWNIDSDNVRPRGITVDPNDVRHLWIVDSTADAIFEYRDAVERESGNYFADRVYDLAGSNSAAQGIADPRSGGVVGDSTNAVDGSRDQPVVADQAMVYEFVNRPALNLKADVELSRVNPQRESIVNEIGGNGRVLPGDLLVDPALDPLESVVDCLSESGREESQESLILDGVFSRLETELALGIVTSGRKLAGRSSL